MSTSANATNRGKCCSIRVRKGHSLRGQKQLYVKSSFPSIDFISYCRKRRVRGVGVAYMLLRSRSSLLAPPIF